MAIGIVLMVTAVLILYVVANSVLDNTQPTQDESKSVSHSVFTDNITDDEVPAREKESQLGLFTQIGIAGSMAIKVLRDRDEERILRKSHGDLNSAMTCPHCQVRGKIRLRVC